MMMTNPLIRVYPGMFLNVLWPFVGAESTEMRREFGIANLEIGIGEWEIGIR